MAFRHVTALSIVVIVISLVSPKSDQYLSCKAPNGSSWSAGRRPHGMTLVPWGDKALFSDVTIVNSVASIVLSFRVFLFGRSHRWDGSEEEGSNSSQVCQPNSDLSIPTAGAWSSWGYQRIGDHIFLRSCPSVFWRFQATPEKWRRWAAGRFWKTCLDLSINIFSSSIYAWLCLITITILGT